METENSQKLFSVSIIHNSKIRKLSDGNKVIVCQTNFLLWVPPFLNYELWKQRIELSKLAIQTSSKYLRFYFLYFIRFLFTSQTSSPITTKSPNTTSTKKSSNIFKLKLFNGNRSWLIKLSSVLSIEACWPLCDVFSLSSFSHFSSYRLSYDTVHRYCSYNP